jgi:hypothetical protein
MLAPFKDYDEDGVYDPMKGDYPLIRGDQTVYFICNDDRFHTETQGGSLMVEIHGMVYGYDEPTDSALMNTVFVHYDLINRSDNTYYDTYCGFYTDFDIGYRWDDFIASDVQRGSYYGYNGMETDGSVEAGSYGQYPPAQSATVLAGPFMDPDGTDNPDGGCDFSVNGLNFGNGTEDDERYGLGRFRFIMHAGGGPIGEPLTPKSYYNYMKGIWKDLTPVQYGAWGHLEYGAVGPACRFMFPGDSDPLNWGTGCEFPNGGYNQDGKFWTEEEAGNEPNDRRGLGSMGPFTFGPGEVQEIEMAFVAANGWDGPVSSVEKLREYIDSLRSSVEEGKIIIPNNELAVEERPEGIHRVILYPNPARTQLCIKLPEVGLNQFDYQVINLLGTQMRSGTIPGSGTAVIKIHDLQKGIYILTVTDGERIYVGKFVRN